MCGSNFWFYGLLVVRVCGYIRSFCIFEGIRTLGKELLNWFQNFHYNLSVFKFVVRFCICSVDTLERFYPQINFGYGMVLAI